MGKEKIIPKVTSVYAKRYGMKVRQNKRELLKKLKNTLSILQCHGTALSNAIVLSSVAEQLVWMSDRGWFEYVESPKKL